MRNHQNDVVKKTQGMIQWNLDASGILTIRGTGSMPDYNCGKNGPAPWQDIAGHVREIRIGEGITKIGIRAFENYNALERVVLPGSLMRIGAYAFKNCRALEKVETAGRERVFFRYVFDDATPCSGKEIVFGLQSFHGVPWADEFFGGMYIVSGVLYVSFERSLRLEVPEGVRHLYDYSFQESPVQEIILPFSLETVGKYAFYRAEVRYLRICALKDFRNALPVGAFLECCLQKVVFPSGMKTIPDRSAFAGTPVGKLMDELASAGKSGVKTAGRRKKSQSKRMGIPELYRTSLKYPLKNRAFRKIIIRSAVPGIQRRLADDCYFGKEYFDISAQMAKRVSAGQLLINISWFRNRVLCVRSYISDGGKTLEYLMFPCVKRSGQQCAGQSVRQCVQKSAGQCVQRYAARRLQQKKEAAEETIVIWSDSLRYLEKDAFRAVFPEPDKDRNASSPENGPRSFPEGIMEEWYSVADPWQFGGTAEMALLKLWIKKHPEVRIDSEEENRAKDRFRWTAAIRAV